MPTSNQTRFSNMINPEVIKQIISAELANKTKFLPLANVDTTLQGQAGDTITIPSFKYIGDAEDLQEGVAMGTAVLETASTQVSVKEAGKAVEITDKAILSGYGDPVGESNKQLLMSIVNKVDNDFVEVLQTAPLEKDESAAKISYGAVVEGVDAFQEEDDEPRVLFIHPNQKTTLRKDDEFLKNVDNAYVKGVIGEIAGCQVVASNKVPYDAQAGTYTNFIVKTGALALIMKKSVEVETDRDILARTNVISAHQHYAVAVADESKVVKLITKA